jgi:hypothetical protein
VFPDPGRDGEMAATGLAGSTKHSATVDLCAGEQVRQPETCPLESSDERLYLKL